MLLWLYNDSTWCFLPHILFLLLVKNAKVVDIILGYAKLRLCSNHAFQLFRISFFIQEC